MEAVRKSEFGGGPMSPVVQSCGPLEDDEPPYPTTPLQDPIARHGLYETDGLEVDERPQR